MYIIKVSRSPPSSPAAAARIITVISRRMSGRGEVRCTLLRARVEMTATFVFCQSAVAGVESPPPHYSSRGRVES